MLCPLCNVEVSNQRGLASHFRHQKNTHPDYSTWIESEKWKDKIKDVDYVVCLECGFKAETLARHLLAEHQINSEQYKEKWGEDVLIRCSKTTEKRKDAIKNRSGGFGKGDTKEIICPSCEKKHTVAKFLSLHIHDPNCEDCKEKLKNIEEQNKWKNLSEPEDYVTCLECNYRAENLTSHINHTHPNYRIDHPGAFIVSLNSSVRDKTHQIGTHHSEETKAKMSEHAGKWNEGLTKENDERVADISNKLLGRTAWNKDQTSETNESIARTSEKLKKFYSENERTWTTSLKANLTLADFKPFMDAEGRVDHHAIIKETGLNWVTIHKYIKELSLEKTKKYITQRLENQTTHIEKEILLKYTLKNNKVALGKAMLGLGHSAKIIKRECKRHGLKTFSRNIYQSACIETISKALYNLFYIQEWHTHKFKNPKTGFRFKFDGYFPELGLVVEFHGHQHYIFPNIYLKTEEEYLALRERDRIKQEMIKQDPNLTYFFVTEDEPFDNIDYIKGKLAGAGIIDLYFSNISL